MDELDRYGTFTDSGGYALDGPVADVANRKDAGDVGFQQERVALDGPTFGVLAIAD